MFLCVHRTGWYIRFLFVFHDHPFLLLSNSSPYDLGVTALGPMIEPRRRRKLSVALDTHQPVTLLNFEDRIHKVQAVEVSLYCRYPLLDLGFGLAGIRIGVDKDLGSVSI